MKIDHSLSLSIDLAKEYIVKIAIVEFPFLALPVINQMFTFIVDKVLSRVENEGQLLISFSEINNRNNAQKEEYEASLKKLSEAKTQEEKNEALRVAKSRLRDLIKFPT